MSKDRSRPAPATDSKQDQYSDGHPLDEVQYLECKLILKPDRFTAAKVFLDYGKLVAKTAKEFVATADNLIAWARTGSLMWMQFGLACCATR